MLRYVLLALTLSATPCFAQGAVVTPLPNETIVVKTIDANPAKVRPLNKPARNEFGFPEPVPPPPPKQGLSWGSNPPITPITVKPIPVVRTIWERGDPLPDWQRAAPNRKPLPPIVRLGKVPASRVGERTLPPPEYDHHYEGHLILKLVDSHLELLTLCEKQRQPNTLACARRAVDGERCWVFMLSDEQIRKRGYTTEILLRHEIGHCNGWPGDHPNAWPLPYTP